MSTILKIEPQNCSMLPLSNVFNFCNPSICVLSFPSPCHPLTGILLSPTNIDIFFFLTPLPSSPLSSQSPPYSCLQNPRGNFLRMTSGEEKIQAFWWNLMILSFGRQAFFSLIIVLYLPIAATITSLGLGARLLCFYLEVVTSCLSCCFFLGFM